MCVEVYVYIHVYKFNSSILMLVVFFRDYLYKGPCNSNPAGHAEASEHVHSSTGAQGKE